MNRSNEDLEKENSILRGLLAKGDKDCFYCGLPAEDINKCPYGFPGCSRMDDIINCFNNKVEDECIDLRLKMCRLEDELRIINGS